MALALLPEELLAAICSSCHEIIGVRELCSLSLVGNRALSRVVDAESRWRELFETQFGPLRPLQHRARALLPSFKAYFAEKSRCNQDSDWRRPCPSELTAALRDMAAFEDVPGRACQAVFLLDGSGSVAADEFSEMTRFVTQATRELVAANPASKVAVLQFSNDVKEEAPLAEIPEGGLDDFAERMRQLTRINGGTNISAALQRAGQLLKPAGDAPRLVVLLTDGRVDAHQAAEAAEVAARLADEQSHVKMHALGVGRGVDEEELVSILAGACGGCEEAKKLAQERYLELYVRDEAPW